MVHQYQTSMLCKPITKDLWGVEQIIQKLVQVEDEKMHYLTSEPVIIPKMKEQELKFEPVSFYKLMSYILP